MTRFRKTDSKQTVGAIFHIYPNIYRIINYAATRPFLVKMAFVQPDELIAEEATVYMPTWDTSEQLLEESTFCPLCEVPDSYSFSGNRPIAQLNKVITDLQVENKLSPVGFLKFIYKYYNEKTKPQLVAVAHWQAEVQEILNGPAWSLQNIHTHFREHVADSWFSRQEALRQTNVMLQRTANTCLTREGPPNANVVRTYVELNKLRESLTLHSTSKSSGIA